MRRLLTITKTSITLEPEAFEIISPTLRYYNQQAMAKLAEYRALKGENYTDQHK